MVQDEPIPCPICSQSVRIDKINEHIDSGCKMPVSSDNTKQKNAWNKIFDTRPKGKARASDEDEGKYLPKASYTVLKDKQLRELLSKYELSTAGDRNALIARHQR